ncbi:unknown [Firmicutes bacterium CAG:822]|nr:unknown [Firmicutes bacterium CAG:822]
MIGYNVTKINELMKELADAYNRCGNTISEGWPAVSQTMQQYWVGEDEQSYEKAFCKRMCEMYVNACEIVKNLTKNLKGLGTEWHNFQQKNLLKDAESVGSFSANLEDVQITANEQIISMRQANVTDSTDRGVKEGALSAIQSSMSEYLSNIKRSLQDIYSGIDGSTAFLGSQQSQTINRYIETIGQSLGSVVTAANDIYTALEQLTQSAYSQSESEVSSQFNSSNAQSEIEGQLGDMKWNG